MRFIGSHVWRIGQLNYVIWLRVQVNNESNIGSVTTLQDINSTLAHHSDLPIATQTHPISYCIGLQPIWWIFLVLFEYGINRCLQLSWWTGLALVSPVGCLAGLIWSGAHSSWCALWLSDFFPHMYTLPGRSHWCNWWPSRWLAVWWEHKDWKVWDRGLGYLIIAIT